MELQVALLLGGDGGLLLAVASLAIRRAGKGMLRSEGIGRDSTSLKICPAREAATINVQHQKGRRDTGSEERRGSEKRWRSGRSLRTRNSLDTGRPADHQRLCVDWAAGGDDPVILAMAGSSGSKTWHSRRWWTVEVESAGESDLLDLACLWPAIGRETVFLDSGKISAAMGFSSTISSTNGSTAGVADASLIQPAR
ncbi:hypothetical protein B0J14DRAFT_561351 [Halenospora varia]|nr:hypothetical protein B0J14DRAFT_561351 [Halenospora varia]